MPYVRSIERLAYERAFEQGYRQGALIVVTKILEDRFGAAGKELLPRFEALEEVGKRFAMISSLVSARTVREVETLLRLITRCPDVWFWETGRCPSLDNLVPRTEELPPCTGRRSSPVARSSGLRRRRSGR